MSREPPKNTTWVGKDKKGTHPLIEAADQEGRERRYQRQRGVPVEEVGGQMDATGRRSNDYLVGEKLWEAVSGRGGRKKISMLPYPSQKEVVDWSGGDKTGPAAPWRCRSQSCGQGKEKESIWGGGGGVQGIVGGETPLSPS